MIIFPKEIFEKKNLDLSHTTLHSPPTPSRVSKKLMSITNPNKLPKRSKDGRANEKTDRRLDRTKIMTLSDKTGSPTIKDHLSSPNLGIQNSTLNITKLS